MTTSAAALAVALDQAHWTTIDLWRAALGTGGAFTRQDVDMVLSGKRPAAHAEHDTLASVLNDHVIDCHSSHRVRYWRELED